MYTLIQGRRAVGMLRVQEHVRYQVPAIAQQVGYQVFQNTKSSDMPGLTLELPWVALVS